MTTTTTTTIKLGDPPATPESMKDGALCWEYKDGVLLREFYCNGKPSAEVADAYRTTPSVPTVDSMPPGRPPSAGLPEVSGSTPSLPEVSGELPRTGAGTTEPLLGFAGLLIVVGIPLVVVAGWRRWRENRHLHKLALMETDRRRNGA